MICRYCNCIFEDRNIPEGTEIKINKSYYHPECAKIKNDIAESIKLFVENFNENVVYSQLTKTLNEIIFTKGIDSGMIVYGLKKWISDKKKLNYPGGLYYLIQDASVQRGWKELQAKKIKEQMISNEAPEERQVQKFGYVKRSSVTIASLMEG